MRVLMQVSTPLAIALLLLVLRIPAMAQCLPSFSQATTLNADRYPQFVVAVDLNGDGVADLATANNFSPALNAGSVGIYIGYGDGTFRAPVSYAVGSAPTRLAVSDLDRDGNLDLAVANNGATTVSVLWGRGDGTFLAAATAFFAGSQPFGIAAADVDASGYVDLVVTNSDGHMSILLSNGNRGFSNPIQYPADSGMREVFVNDFNADGIPDIVASRYDCCRNQLLAYRGIGDGSFFNAVSFSTGRAYAQDLVVADFNSDGRPDVAVGVDDSNGSVQILLGAAPAANGTPAFQMPLSFPTNGGNAASLATGDVNGDGYLDLLVANYASNSVALLRGAAGPTFVGPLNYPTNGAPIHVAVADLNQDGRLDTVATNNLNPGRLSVLLDGGRQPSIVEQPGDVRACRDRVAQIIVAATNPGSGTLSYQWQKSGTPLTNGPRVSGAASPTLVLSGLGDGDAGSYSCVVQNGCGSTTSHGAELRLWDSCLLGDLNCDHVVNNFDIDAFVLALIDESGYSGAFPSCTRLNGDVDRSGQMTNFDIDPFVACLVPPPSPGSGCP